MIEFVTQDLAHLDPDEQRVLEDAFKELEETHAKFKQAFCDIFLKKADEHSDFLNEFVHLCTGQAYLPDAKARPNFKIKIEFNDTQCDPKHCPSIHTCDNLIKIPATCCDLDMTIFLEKLKTTMDLAQGGFDMK